MGFSGRNRKDFSVHRCKECEIPVMIPMYEWKKTQRRRPYCPKCGENIYVEHVRNIAIESPLGGKKRIYTDEEEDDLIECYKRGYSYKEIAELLDRNVDALRAKILKLKKEGRL